MASSTEIRWRIKPATLATDIPPGDRPLFYRLPIPRVFGIRPRRSFSTSAEPTCATCRRSWAIRVSQQPRATRTSIPSGCAWSWETFGCTRKLFFCLMSQGRPKEEKVGEIAAKAVVQLLFATGKSFTVDGLREKLREFFRQEIRAELRAVAALNNVELITALISFNRQLALVGLQLRIPNGVVSLLIVRSNKGPNPEVSLAKKYDSRRGYACPACRRLQSDELCCRRSRHCFRRIRVTEPKWPMERLLHRARI